MRFVTTIQRDKHLHYYREKEKKSEIREHWNKGNKKVKKKKSKIIIIVDTLRCALVKRSILNDYYLMFFLIIFTTSHLSNQLAIIYWTLIIISLPILAPPLWRNLAIEGLHDDIDFFFILKKDKKIFLCFNRSTAEGASE